MSYINMELCQSVRPGGGLDYYEDSLVLLIVLHQVSTERVHQYELYQHGVMSVSQPGGGGGGVRLLRRLSCSFNCSSSSLN